jgi:protein-disulfide isomerase|tara:strand:+ start:1264 stop:1911 length:648 start_codon:yes stop_codon:yes gene_type:complete
MNKKELEYVDYLLKKFKEVKDEKPIFKESIKALELQREIMLGNKDVPIATETPPTIGKDNASITLIEFMDFECPPCKKATQVIKKILKKYPDDIRLVFRNFPRIEKHPFAIKAAEAALCAHKQGKFWEYCDRLFENQDNLNDKILTEIAKNVGLDMNGFNGCYLFNESAKRVSEDLDLALALDVKMVPTFFINGQKIDGRNSLKNLEKIIEKKLG